MRAFARGGRVRLQRHGAVQVRGLAAGRAPHAARRSWREAANTLRFDAEADGGWWCDNTDGAGLVRDITVNAGVTLAGRRVLLIGAGGAAAGVLGPLIEAAPAELVLVNRTLDKALALAERHAALAARHGVALAVRPLPRPVRHSTSSSTAPPAAWLAPACRWPPRCCGRGALALDMMYGAGARGFLDWAAAHGAVGRDGLGMLVEQAAEAFLAWRGVRPDTAPVLAALRAEVDAAARAA